MLREAREGHSLLLSHWQDSWHLVYESTWQPGIKKKNKQQTASRIPSSMLTACLAHLAPHRLRGTEAEQLFFVSKRKGQGIVFYMLHCESVNGFAAHNVQGLFGVSARASPHPGGTTGSNSRVNPGWGEACGWLVVTDLHMAAGHQVIIHQEMSVFPSSLAREGQILP